MPDPMSNERLANLLNRLKRHALSNPEADELAVEIVRMRERESTLVDEVDRRVKQLRRANIGLSRARQATSTEPELEWGVRSTNRSTGRTEDISQPSETSARSQVVSSMGASVLICRTKAGPWREVESGEA